MKKWHMIPPAPEAAAAIARGSDLSPLCAAILAARGCMTLEDAASYLRADELASPELLPDLTAAAEILAEVADSGQRICVYGDYDCDGIIATAMLYSYLCFLDADVIWRIPERSEGYGLHPEIVHELADQGVSLIVTVDNGISALEESGLIAERGMRLLVTDHHRPPDQLPQAEALVDPYLPGCTAPFRQFCGAGVVLKLIAGMEGGDCDMILEQFGDLAAVATIADVVPLTGENRTIVKRGLAYLENTERVGLRTLLEAAGLSEGIPGAASVAFQLSPLINAAGRFASPSLAVKLLLTEDPEEAAELTAQLKHCNQQRREAEQHILDEIDVQLTAHPELLYQRVLVVSGENWHCGVIGIVAARLLERFGKPVFVLSSDGREIRGSARSFGAFSVHACLKACASFLTHWGGHPGAGGFSLLPDQLASFSAAVLNYAAAEHDQMPVPELTVDYVLQASDLTERAFDGLSALEPFGAGNPQPVFGLAGALLLRKEATKNGLHTRLQLSYGGQKLTAYAFRTPPDQYFAQPQDCLDLLIEISGKFVKVIDARPSGMKQSAFFAAQDTFERIMRGEPVPKAFLSRGVPDREELVAVYQRLSRRPQPVETVFMRLASESMNYCKYRLCLEIFRELNLVQFQSGFQRIQTIPASKTDLTASPLYRRLHAELEHTAQPT